MPRAQKPTDRLTNWVALGVIRVLLRLPYRMRVRLMGAIMSYIVAPAIGYRKRILDNLNLVMPDLSKREKRRIMRAVPDNMGRTMIEIYSQEEFKEHCKGLQVQGPGAEVLRRARDENTPVLLMTAHLGNYDALRAALVPRGYRISALFRPMNNPFFHRHYVQTISGFGPVYGRDRSGLAQTVKHLKSGGMMGMLVDIRMSKGEPLMFFGQPALTATSAAEMSIKYNAPLIPIYAPRNEDGLTFSLFAEAPIPQTTPIEMTQALNDSLEAVIRKNMGQWLWAHRRWKLRKRDVSGSVPPPRSDPGPDTEE